MSRTRKLVMMLGLLFASTSMMVGCSDDDADMMGPISINSLQTTATTATIYWTIVPNSSCDGYQVTINEGTRANKGVEVINQKFDNRTANYTFEGLTPNTQYVVTTVGIPAAGSGFTGALPYEKEFTTKAAPAN